MSATSKKKPGINTILINVITLPCDIWKGECFLPGGRKKEGECEREAVWFWA